MDWVAGSMFGGTLAEHLGPNLVWMIARILMMQELYLRLEYIEYLGKIGQLGIEPKNSIIWG